jgi:hypothetical protein
VSRARLAAALLAALALLGVATPAPGPPTQRWLLVSDVHFDPFADPTLVDRLAAAPVAGWETIFAGSAGRTIDGYGTDTDDALLDSALTAMRVGDPAPAVVVVDGDFLAHGFEARFDKAATVHDAAAYDAFVDKTIAYLALRFGETFPNAQFVPSIGNNDSYCGDYASAPGSPFLAHFAAAWAPLAQRGGAAPDFVAGIAAAGHYVTGVPGTPLHVVVPNSVVWSARYADPCGPPHADPSAAELTWLTGALRAGEPPTLVVTHIPPGVDVYASLSAKTPTLTYADGPNAAVPALIAAPAANVTTVIAGHFHTDGFRIVGATSPHPVPLLLVPSISPIFGNAPAFVDAQVDAASGVVLDATTTVLAGLPALGSPSSPAATTWNVEYTYAQAYHLRALSAAGLAALQHELVEDPATRANFERWFVSGSPIATMTEVNWTAYWCADVALDVRAWQACLAQQPGAASQ